MRSDLDDQKVLSLLSFVDTSRQSGLNLSELHFNASIILLVDCPQDIQRYVNEHKIGYQQQLRENGANQEPFDLQFALSLYMEMLLRNSQE